MSSKLGNFARAVELHSQKYGKIPTVPLWVLPDGRGLTQECDCILIIPAEDFPDLIDPIICDGIRIVGEGDEPDRFGTVEDIRGQWPPPEVKGHELAPGYFKYLEELQSQEDIVEPESVTVERFEDQNQDSASDSSGDPEEKEEAVQEALVSFQEQPLAIPAYPREIVSGDQEPIIKALGGFVATDGYPVRDYKKNGDAVIRAFILDRPDDVFNTNRKTEYDKHFRVAISRYKRNGVHGTPLLFYSVEDFTSPDSSDTAILKEDLLDAVLSRLGN